MSAFYNEHDPKAAAWLKELISHGHIAPGEVDERSIEDISPDELSGFTQCHFFAGIGVWSYALRRAGWADDRPVWTGSCPCQPFSAAGQQKGIKDERHLWPAWFRLIEARRPPVIFGEQVSSAEVVGSSLEAAFVVAVREGNFARANKLAKQLVGSKSFHYWRRWIDIVCGEMEGVGYAVRPEVLGAHSFGAPHIRQRLYFVADAMPAGRAEGWAVTGHGQIAGSGGVVGLALTDDPERRADATSGHERDGDHAGRAQGASDVEGRGEPCGLADADSERRSIDARLRERQGDHSQIGGNRKADGLADATSGGCGERGNAAQPGRGGHVDGSREDMRPGPVNGFWRAADWLHCTDGKWRPVEASAQPMADGSAVSLGRVRDYCIAEFQEEVDAASVEGQIERTALMRALRSRLETKARSVWQIGGVPGLHEAPFLLALLRQFEAQGWHVQEGVSLSCSEASIARLRSVRDGEPVAGASHQRGLEGQPAREPANIVHILSSLLARHAHSSWAENYAAYAEIGFPLGRNSLARVARLRGYGNAICAEAAKAFIESYLEVSAP